MQSWLKIIAIIVGVFSGLSGCAGVVDKIQRDHDAIVRANGGVAMAAQPDASLRKPTQLITPVDKQVTAAMNEALPTIKKVLGIHQCVQNNASLRLMNIYATPGTDLSQSWHADETFPNSSYFMKYHDQNKCVSVSAIDHWSMPALNALFFRAVYFADDSGETVNFDYLFKKVDDGSWKLETFKDDR